MTRTAVRVVVSLLALSALAVACGEDDDSSSSSGPRTDPPASTDAPASTSPPPGAGACTFEGGVAPVQQATPTETLVLTDVRMAGHECFDRIVFEFRGTARPGFEVEYLEGPPVEDPTGNPVEVAGSVFLEIRMQSASGFDFEANTPSYDGPSRLTPTDTIYAREAARTGDFEAILIWVVGLDEERPFTATTLADPARVVVDIG